MKLQSVDSTLHTLTHRRDHLPEQAELVALAATREPVDNKVRDARIVVDDLQIELDKAESDVEQVKARFTRDTDRVQSGAIADPKALTRMQSELESLARRIDVLENEELEVMERMEAAQAALGVLTDELAGIDAKARELMTSRDAKRSEIDAEIAQVASTRPAETMGIPADLLALYDKLRETKGGVGAAELRLRQCNGCMLSLDTAELAAVKARPSDDVVRCEECSRILVRTPESGL